MKAVLGVRRTEHRRWIALAAVAALALSVMVVARARLGGATPSFKITQFSGTDRYDTARQVAEAAFPTGSATVLLASGTNYPDALAGAYLAGNEDVPVLLTDPSSVPGPTVTALQELKVKNVVILGGNLAVGDAVANRLTVTASTSSQGGNLVVSRVAGATRYETASMIATSGGTVGRINNSPAAIVASGANFPDALSAGPASFSAHLPILLTDPNQESPATEAALSKLGVTQVILMGGSGAVSDAVAAELAGNGTRTVTRIVGADRTDTAAKFYEQVGLKYLSFSTTTIFLANGTTTFPAPDALAGAPLAGKTQAAILLATSPDTLGQYTTSEIQSHSSSLTSGVILGGPAAISATGSSAFAAAAGGASTSNGPITLNSTTVPPGSSINGTVANPSNTSSLTADGCGLKTKAVTFGTTSGAFSVTIPATQAPGTCTLTFTVKFKDSTPTATPSFTITVTSSTAFFAVPSLTSVTVNRLNGQANDTATFSFSGTLATTTPSADHFHLYRASGTVVGGVGLPVQSGSSFTVSFPPGAAQNVTLGGVIGATVTDTGGHPNFPGSVPVQAAYGSPIASNEPDLLSVGSLSQEASPSTDFTLTYSFDKPFQTVKFGATSICTPQIAGATTPTTNGLWAVIQTDGSEHPADVSTATVPFASSGAVSGGVCSPATSVVVRFPHLDPSTLVGAAVKQGAVAKASTDPGNPIGSATLSTGAASSFPVLSQALEVHGGGVSTNVIFTFSQAVTSGGTTANKFVLILGDGTEAAGTGTAPGPGGSSITVSFPSAKLALAVGAAMGQGADSKFSSPDTSLPLSAANAGISLPQVIGVAITSGSAPAGPTVTYTFDKNLLSTTAPPATDFFLYDDHGGSPTSPSAAGTVSTDGSGNPTNTIVFSCQVDGVSCSGFTAAQVSGKAAGGVDHMTGNPPPFPEGAQAASTNGSFPTTTTTSTTVH